MKKFSTILKQLRKTHNLSQNKLANLCGLTSSAISQYESNQRIPSYTALIKLSTGLKIPIEDLFDPELSQYFRGYL